MNEIKIIDKLQDEILELVKKGQDEADLAKERKLKEITNFKKQENISRMRMLSGKLPPRIPKHGEYEPTKQDKAILESEFLSYNGHGTVRIDLETGKYNSKQHIPETGLGTGLKGTKGHKRINDVIFDGNQQPLKSIFGIKNTNTS